MIKLKDLLNEEVLSLTEKQLKGLNGIDDNSPSGIYKCLPFIWNLPSYNKSFNLIIV